jgi:hypothetical protein
MASRFSDASQGDAASESWLAQLTELLKIEKIFLRMCETQSFLPPDLELEINSISSHDASLICFFYLRSSRLKK